MPCSTTQPCGPEVHNLHCGMPNCAWGRRNEPPLIPLVQKPKAKPGEPLSAAVAKKFKEQNDKVQREALILAHIDRINGMLEANDCVQYYDLGFDPLLTAAVEKKFIDAGWKVRLSSAGQGESAKISIELE